MYRRLSSLRGCVKWYRRLSRLRGCVKWYRRLSSLRSLPTQPPSRFNHRAQTRQSTLPSTIARRLDSLRYLQPSHADYARRLARYLGSRRISGFRAPGSNGGPLCRKSRLTLPEISINSPLLSGVAQQQPWKLAQLIDCQHRAVTLSLRRSIVRGRLRKQREPDNES